MGITTVGKNLSAALLGAVGAPTALTHIELGTGTTAFAVGDTTLTAITDSGLARAAVAPTSSTNVTTQTKTWTATGTKVVGEAGCFNAAAAGTMFCRQVLGTARTLVSGDQITVTWNITST